MSFTIGYIELPRNVYLAGNGTGDSRILVLSGTVSAIRTNQGGETVVVLRAAGAKAGVACTFAASHTPAPDAIALLKADHKAVSGLFDSLRLKRARVAAALSGRDQLVAK